MKRKNIVVILIVVIFLIQCTFDFTNFDKSSSDFQYDDFITFRYNNTDVSFKNSVSNLGVIQNWYDDEYKQYSITGDYERSYTLPPENEIQIIITELTTDAYQFEFWYYEIDKGYFYKYTDASPDLLIELEYTSYIGQPYEREYWKMTYSLTGTTVFTNLGSDGPPTANITNLELESTIF